MIKTCSRSLQICVLRRWTAANFCSSAIAATRQPNPPLQLDPSMEALLKDVDMSLLNHKKAPSHRELEIFLGETSGISNALEPSQVEESAEDDVELSKKSPAAEFGSHRIGAVVLPSQLTKSINQLIQESNKALLHVDAKRLFLSEDGTEEGERGWGTQYDARYRSKTQSARHAERDGIAFASIAFPAHYSAIIAVLDHIRKRLGPSWSVQNVIDWGAAAGSGLWASVHSFQIPSSDATGEEYLNLSDSTISSYTGIDKRDGLISIGKRLVNGIDCGKLQIRWRKSFEKEDTTSSEDKQTLALSAFLLSTLSTPVARKMMVKEIWESGAEVMVLIDHKTAAGFGAIAEAREYLLKLGKKEIETSQDQDEILSGLKGSHIIAPCPHDGACPLFQGGTSRLACGFSQRIQRPDFIRRTKHSKIGHENIEYSYIVIRRGTRPVATTQAGRIGEVGLRALQQAAVDKIPIKELSLHDGSEELGPVESDETENPALPVIKNPEELEATLRQEAFNWPRLIFPPLKRSGHVILDGCTIEGRIMRMIIPRSQGKQPYYDARKSRWGDMFPHHPKKPGQERHLGPKGKQDTRVNGESSERGKLEVPRYEESVRLSHKQRKKPRRYHLERLLSQTE